MTEKFNEERKIYTVSECLPTNYLFIIKSGKVLTFLWGKGPQSERPRKGTNRNHPIGGSGRTTSLLWHTRHRGVASENRENIPGKSN